MEAILRSAHGYVGYFLIAQILVVAGLFLALLWLIFRRIWEGSSRTNYPAAEASAQVTAAAEAWAAPRAAEPISEAPAPSYDSAEAAQNRRLIDDNRALEEKVRYLEKKLLEYEILQEEIGTLGALKTENEQLKKDLVQWQAILQPNSSEPQGIEPKDLHSSSKEAEAALAGLQGLIAQIDELTKRDEKVSP